MMGTINCIYETPCGWCTKFDEPCEVCKIKSINKPQKPKTNPALNIETSKIKTEFGYSG